MENYKSNSHKSKSKEKKVEKVVSGDVKTKKKSEIRKFTDNFISEDVDNVKSYIFGEVILPAVKDIISSTIRSAVDMLLYGDSRPSRSRGRNDSRVSYERYYDRSDRRERSNKTYARTGYNFDDIIIADYGEAEEVLSQMDNLIDVYGIVSVGDFYDLVGIQGNFTDNKYGWTNISSAKIVRTRDGEYFIKLPRACPIDNG